MLKVQDNIELKSLPESKVKKRAPRKSKKLEGRIFRTNMPCGVCGDKAKAQNYGGISCNSCRSFFHYYVLHKVPDPTCFQHLGGNCKFAKKCVVDKLTRKKCKPCRFFKCVSIGMSPAWVWRQYEKAQEIKQKNDHANVLFDQKTKILSDEETQKIENLSKFYQSACELIPYTFLTRAENEVLTCTKISLIDIGRLSTAIRRFVCFARMLPEFANLSLHDQSNLLRRSVLEMLFLRALITYDIENCRVGSYTDKFPEKFPVLTEDEFISVIPKHVAEMYFNLYKRIRSIAPDETSIMLLIPLALFSDSGGNENCTDFDDTHAINSAQELYTSLLEKYLTSTQGRAKGRLLFPRLLSQLASITEISHLHQGLPLNMTDDQVDKMHQHLHLLQMKSGERRVNHEPPFPGNGTPFVQQQRECCKKFATLEKPGFPKTGGSNFPASTPETLPFLIHTFVNVPGEFGIRQDYYEKGAHIGVEKALMRRMPQLLACPWDSLVNSVENLVISDVPTFAK